MNCISVKAASEAGGPTCSTHRLVDVLRGEKCDGRMDIVAFVTDPNVAAGVLQQLRMSAWAPPELSAVPTSAQPGPRPVIAETLRHALTGLASAVGDPDHEA